MESFQDKTYRGRIYGSYVSHHIVPLVSVKQDGLKPPAPHFKRIVTRHLSKGKQPEILGIGCGQGAVLYLAKAASYVDVRGVDCSPEQVEAA